MEIFLTFGAALGAAFLVGGIMGLVGSGGAVITTPVLILLLERPPSTAISESLAIVCFLGSLIALHSGWTERISYRTLASFGPAGILGVLASSFCAPFVPPAAQIMILGLLALWAARSTGVMHRDPTHPEQSLIRIFRAGILAGFLTGLAGVSGGIILVPALFRLGLKISLAIGTASVLIALNCGAAFLKRTYLFPTNEIPIDFNLIILFCSLGTLGLVAAAKVHALVQEAAIRRWYSRLLVVVGVLLLAQAAHSFG